MTDSNMVVAWVFLSISIVTLFTLLIVWIIKRKKSIQKKIRTGMIEKHEWKNIAVMSIITFLTLAFFYSLKAIIVIQNPLLEGSVEGFIGGITFVICTVLALYIAQSRLDRGKTKK